MADDVPCNPVDDRTSDVVAMSRSPPPVCAENVVRFDLVRESVNDSREGRAERRSLEHAQLEW